MLLGDFNLQISDSHVLAQALQQKVWCDTRDHSSLEVQNTPTCHKGKGSFIDHIWVSPNLYDLCNSFAITKHHEFKDHSLLTIKIGIPRSEQNIKSLRSVRKLPDALPLPSRDDSKIPSAISPKFQCAINSQDVDAAYKYWSQEFERILFIIAGKLPASQTDSVAAKRGQIVFHDQRKFPKTVQGHASTTRKARKLWKAHCQLVEILIATSGTRRDRTIANVAKIAQWLPQHQSNDFITSINCSNFQYALHLIKSALDANVKEDKQQRILHWKQKIRSDNKHSFQYLKSKAASAPIKVSQVNDTVTAEAQTRLDSISNVWKAIYSKHAQGEPSFHNFMSKYGSTMKSQIIDLGTIQEDHVLRILRQMKNNAPGLDQIMVAELKAAVSWSPTLLTALVDLFNCIEISQK